VKNYLLVLAASALLAGVPAAALVPASSALVSGRAAAAKKKETPAQELVKEVAAAETGVTTLLKMKADAANGIKAPAPAAGKDAKVPESPGVVLTKTLGHLDLVITYGEVESRDKLVVAAKQLKAALDAHNWDAVTAVAEKMKTLPGASKPAVAKQ
jgi:hypothetical protein